MTWLVPLLVLGQTPLNLISPPSPTAPNPAAQTVDSAATQHEAETAPAPKVDAPPAPQSSPPQGAPATLFVRANTAYDAGNYREAATLYESLLRTNPTGYIYYNLGNSYLRLGQLGKGIAAYLRSQALLPRDQDVVANLRFARQSTKDAVKPARPSAVLRTLFFWHYSLGRNELWAATGVFSLLLWTALAIRLWMRESEILKWLGYLAGCGVLALGLSLAMRTLKPTRVAVVQSEQLQVHAGTGRDTVVRFELHEGTEMEVVAQRDEWVRVRLPDGKQGWVASSEVDVVVL